MTSYDDIVDSEIKRNAKLSGEKDWEDQERW